MRLYVDGKRVFIDDEREDALREFSKGMDLPPPSRRTVGTMIAWFDHAMSRLDIDDENDALRYAGLVLDKQYLRLVERNSGQPSARKA